MKRPERITIGVPKIFKADLTGDFFHQCIYCECDLADRTYVIEKAFKAYDGLNNYATIFEYAMCLPCVEMMRTQLSNQSQQSINAFFEQHLQVEDRHRLLESGETDINAWLNECAITGSKASELREFQIYGHCNGDQLMLDHYPFMLGGPVIDEMVNLLSNKTLDDLQNFTHELVGGPPEFADLLKTGPRVFI